MLAKISRRKAEAAIFLFLLALAIVTAISPQIFWGFETIAGSDIIKHFVRAEALAHHDTDIFHHYPETRLVNMYPPGLHLLMASIMQLSSIYNLYLFVALIKITFMVVILLLYFIIGKKISTEIGLLAMFFRLFMFYVTPNVRAKYIYILADQMYFTAWNITELFVLLSILSLYYLLFESNLTKKRFLVWDLILLFSVVFHGVSHISTFVGYFVCVPLFLIVLAIIYAPVKSLRKVMLTRIMHVISILGISICCAYVIYYKKLTELVLAEGYDISSLLPSCFPPFFIHNHLPCVIAISIACCISMLLSYKYSTQSQTREKIEIPDKGLKLLSVLYIVAYICTIIAVHISSKYMHIVKTASSGYNIGAFYPIFFMISSNPITMLTQVEGVGLFLLSIFGLVNFIKSENLKAKYIALFYISSYFAWFLFFIPLPYYSHRIGIFRFFIPFLFAGAVMFIYQYSSKLSTIFKRFKPSSVLFKKNINLGTFLVIALLLLFIVVNGMSSINKDPCIRTPNAFSSPLRLGTLSPPFSTSEFLDRIDAWTEPEEVVLAMPVPTQWCLAAATDIKPTCFGYHSQYDPLHSEFSEIQKAFLYEGEYMHNFFKEYNASYLVIIIYDSYHSRKFDNNPNLIKIYEDPYGEAIYVYQYT